MFGYRHRDRQARSGEGIDTCLRRKPVLSTDQEMELKATVFDMESKLFGLTKNDVRHDTFYFTVPFTATICRKVWHAARSIDWRFDLGASQPDVDNCRQRLWLAHTTANRLMGVLAFSEDFLDNAILIIYFEEMSVCKKSIELYNDVVWIVSIYITGRAFRFARPIIPCLIGW